MPDAGDELEDAVVADIVASTLKSKRSAAAPSSGPSSPTATPTPATTVAPSALIGSPAKPKAAPKRRGAVRCPSSPPSLFFHTLPPLSFPPPEERREASPFPLPGRRLPGVPRHPRHDETSNRYAEPGRGRCPCPGQGCSSPFSSRGIPNLLLSFLPITIIFPL